jgi:signal transduction histidine kinase
MAEQASGYPGWLVEAIVQFNHNTTCINEFELLGVTVDLQRQPDLPQRLDVFFTSLQRGLAAGRGTLVSGNFLALSFVNYLSHERVSPKFVELGKKARSMVVLEGDERATAHAYKRALDQSKAELDADQSVVVVQIPYFIRKVSEYAGRKDLLYDTFREKFDKKQVLFTTPRVACSETDAFNWLDEHSPDIYEQRFLLTLGMAVRNGIQDDLQRPEIQNALGYLLGSFLSWAGMGAGDSTRYLVASVAARVAHFSHEFLKPIAEVMSYLEKKESDIPEKLRKLLDDVFTASHMVEISGMSDTSEQSPMKLLGLLRNALRSNTTFKAEDVLQNGVLRALHLTISDVPGVPAEFHFKDLPDDSLRVRFDPSYFNRLMRNLLRNAAQNLEVPRPIQLEIRFEPYEADGLLYMHFKQRGANIDVELRRTLFRAPVKRPLSRSMGIGLWTIGLAFEAQRLPLPLVTQDVDGIRFTFRFPIERSGDDRD